MIFSIFFFLVYYGDVIIVPHVGKGSWTRMGVCGFTVAGCMNIITLPFLTHP